MSAERTTPALGGSAPRQRGGLEAPRDLPVGGQAVLEGVMMRGVSTWAVAVRRPTAAQRDEGELDPTVAAEGEIEIVTEPLVSYAKSHRWARLPVLRGMVALFESLRIGLRALGISLNVAQPVDEHGRRQEVGGATWAGTVAFALAFAVCLFFLLPAAATNLFRDAIPSSVGFVVIEKLVRVAVFLVYIWLVSRLSHLQRVFQYHGAEHKAISCYEAGLDLTPDNAQRFSRLHPRCGTSFLLIVMVVAVFVFAPLGKLDWQWLLISRVVGIPLVAGVAFEIIKWLGRNRTRRWARVLIWPGLQLQRLTTREPDLAQLAVAVAALDAVLRFEDPAEVTDAERTAMEVGA